MHIQRELWPKNALDSDIVYTPVFVSKHIIQWLKPTGKILDPCKGEGAFYDYFPNNKDYCEIREGKDFLMYSEKVDWVIGNPPYSIFEDFLRKAFEISDNVSYLVPTNKIFQRQIIMEMINKFGGIKSMIIYGSGQLIDFPFGFSVANFHFERNFKGQTNIVMGMKSIFKKDND